MELVSRAETVQVLAGIFHDCFHFHYHFKGADNDWSEWIAPGIGLVRFIHYGFAVMEYQLINYQLLSGNNQIINGSFETESGQPTLAGWENYGGQSRRDAPPGGGQWCLELSGGCVWGYCSQPVPNIQHGEIWRLSCRAKRFGYGGGLLGWRIRPHEHRYYDIFVSDTVWTQISRVDTFALVPGDTVNVVLQGGGGIIGVGGAYFDLLQVERLGVITSIEDVKKRQIPVGFDLKQNYPNPFNQCTVLSFQIPVGLSTEIAILKIYNLMGQEVQTLVNEQLPAGPCQLKFDASNLPSGLYFYRLKAGSFECVRKMIFAK